MIQSCFNKEVMADLNPIVPYSIQIEKTYRLLERAGLHASKEAVFGALFINAIGYMFRDLKCRPMPLIQLMTLGVFLCIFLKNAKHTNAVFSEKRENLKDRIVARKTAESELLTRLDTLAKRRDIPHRMLYQTIAEHKRKNMNLHIVMDPAYDGVGACFSEGAELGRLNTTEFAVIHNLKELDELALAYTPRSFEFIRFDAHGFRGGLDFGGDYLTAETIRPDTWHRISQLARKALVFEACSVGKRGGIADAIAALNLSVPIVAPDCDILHLKTEIACSPEKQAEIYQGIFQQILPLVKPKARIEGLSYQALSRLISLEERWDYCVEDLVELALERERPCSVKDISFTPCL